MTSELRAKVERGESLDPPTVLALLDAADALRTVHAWIRDGEGTESDAAEAMDAALSRLDALKEKT